MNLKFDESKVINALHTDLVTPGSTGIFASNIVSLKERVEKRDEKAFDTVGLSKDKLHPFSGKDKHGNFSYFYPLTQEEVFGEGYIDYLKNCKMPDYKKNLSYKDYVDLVKNKNNNIKKYLFSGKCTRTDWLDGEVYNANVDYGDSYGEDHGKVDKVALTVKAPNELLAKITASVWFKYIGGWHKTGCNYNGMGWVDSNEFYDIRYFGEFNESLSYEEILQLIKFYDTKTNYNLNGKHATISFTEVLEKDEFNSYMSLDLEESYDFEKDLIISGKYKEDVSLKSKILSAFRNAKIDETEKIYREEVDSLVSDFDNTINAIIKSINSFNSISKKDVKELNDKMLKAYNADIKFVRPPVYMKNGKDLNSGNIFAAAISTYHTCSYYNKSNFNSAYYTAYAVKPDASISDLVKTSFEAADKKISENSYYRSVLSTKKYIIFPIGRLSSHLEDYSKETQKYIAADFFKWPNIADGISPKNYIEIKDSFKDSDGYSVLKEIEIEDAKKEGNKCIKIYLNVKNYNYYCSGSAFDYDPKKSFTWKRYKKFREALFNAGYHLVMADHQKEDRENGYEEMDVYFAKNKKGIDYSSTFTGEFWDTNVRPKIERLW